MNKFLRSSAFTLAFGYVAFGIAALVLFAAPLWYAWHVTLQDARTEVLRADTQRLSEIFRRAGRLGAVDLHRQSRWHADSRRAHPAVRRLNTAPLVGQPAGVARPRFRPSRVNTTCRSPWPVPTRARCSWRTCCPGTITCWWAGISRCLRRWRRVSGTGWARRSRCCRSPACWAD